MAMAEKEEEGEGEEGRSLKKPKLADSQPTPPSSSSKYEPPGQARRSQFGVQITFNHHSTLHTIILYYVYMVYYYLQHTYLGDGNLLHQIMKEEWEWRLQDSPELACIIGRHDVRPGALDDRSLLSFSRRAKHAEVLLSRLRALGPQWDARDELNRALLVRRTEEYLAGLRFRTFLMPLNLLEGPYTDLAQVASYCPFKTEQDYRHYLSRLLAIPQQLQQNTELLKQGVKEGRVSSRACFKGVEEQIRAHIKTDKEVESSVFYAPFKQKLSDLHHIDNSTRSELKEQALLALKNHVIPALRTFLNFVLQGYVPHLRESIACSDLPEGKALYEQCLRFHTSTDLTPDSIHELGLQVWTA